VTSVERQSWDALSPADRRNVAALAGLSDAEMEEASALLAPDLPGAAMGR
jgi:hypothetical protein